MTIGSRRRALTIRSSIKKQTKLARKLTVSRSKWRSLRSRESNLRLKHLKPRIPTTRQGFSKRTQREVSSWRKKDSRSRTKRLTPLCMISSVR